MSSCLEQPHEKCKGTSQDADCIALNSGEGEGGMKFEDSLVTLVGEIKEQLTNKESDVPLQARFPYLAIMWQRYQVLTSKIDKTKMLDEASAVTRLNR